jgi:MFS family permease
VTQQVISNLFSVGSKAFSSLQNRAYRIYFLGVLGQFASMNMQMVTGSLLIYRLTGSAALLGTLSLAHAIPTLLLSLFGGAIADRVQKKQILIIGLASSALVSLAIGLALSTGYLSKERVGSWWILIASSFIQGIIMGLMMPARQAIIPELVTKEQATNAIALNTMGMNVLSLIAPAVAGFLVDSFNFASAYYAMTALNFWGVGFIVFVPPTRQLYGGGGNILADIKDGFKYVGKQRIILIMLIFTLFFVILSMPYRQLLPIYADDILKVGATGMGLLMSASGVGALVGSLTLAFMPNKNRGLILLLSGVLSGLAITAFSWSTLWGPSLVFIALIGLGQTGRVTTANALLQSYVEIGYMGRVMSINMMEWGLVSFTTFFAGAMAEALPVQWVVGGLGILLVLVTVITIVKYPELRKLD